MTRFFQNFVDGRFYRRKLKLSSHACAERSQSKAQPQKTNQGAQVLLQIIGLIFEQAG
jgi:hypothetical protein